MPSTKRNLLVSRRRHDDDDEDEDDRVPGDSDNISSNGSADIEDEADTESILTYNPTASATSSPVLERQPVPKKDSSLPHQDASGIDTAPGNEAVVRDGQSGRQHQSGHRSHGKNNNSAVTPIGDRTSNTYQAASTDRGRQSGMGVEGWNQVQASRERRGQYLAPARRFVVINHDSACTDDDYSDARNHLAHNKRWKHDLHDSLNTAQRSRASQPSRAVIPKTAPVQARSFSVVYSVGTTTLRIALPNVSEVKRRSVELRRHTLLPNHRPPLRRDKPVRLSLPDTEPRYVFPSIDKSFIFIPRALRPNQNSTRGRGRVSFHGSRRTSVYGGSACNPSNAVSRRSSVAPSIANSGFHTPTGAQNSQLEAVAYRPATMLMHQPYPQKQISVAGIEADSEQPFEQQNASVAAAQAQQAFTQIPQAAVYAQEFQPYVGTVPLANGYYGLPAIYPPPIPFVNPGLANQETGGVVYYADPYQQLYNPVTVINQQQYYYPSMPGAIYYQ